MKKSHYEDHIQAGTIGYYKENWMDYGPLIVQPLVHGSILPARRGYRWIVRNSANEILFIPIRFFIPEKFFDPKTGKEKSSKTPKKALPSSAD